MNNNLEIKAVVFDLDGTLVNSAIDFHAMKEALIDILVASGVKPGILSTSEFNYEIIRKGLDNLEKIGISKAEKRRVMSRISSTLNDIELQSVNFATEIDGASETLRILRENGAKIGVSTRACRDYTISVMDSCGLDDYVDSFVARDDVREAKPSPEQLLVVAKKLGVNLRNLLFVGDSIIDALSAKNACVRFIGVLSGISDKNHFKASECITILRTITDLPPRIVFLLPKNYNAKLHLLNAAQS